MAAGCILNRTREFKTKVPVNIEVEEELSGGPDVELGAIHRDVGELYIARLAKAFRC